jgi:Zn-dependent alcohol dehydrogenase
MDINNRQRSNPALLGHEGTGIIVKAGDNVTHVKEEDDVLISWMPYGADERTEYLQWSNISWNKENIQTLIFTWAEHAIMHSQFVSKMDSRINKYTASIIGCAGIAGYGTVMNTVKIHPGQSTVVWGVGGLGVLAVNAAKDCGSNPIIAVDIEDRRLEFSKKFGATHCINANNSDPVEQIHEITGGGADYVFDMVGKAEIREQTILASRPGIPGHSEGGTVVLTGFPEGVSKFNPRSILMGQRTYKGSRGGACVPERDFPLFFKAEKAGDLELEAAVTERYKLEEINEAIQRLQENKILGRAIIEIA